MEFVNLVEICLWPHLALKGLFNNLYYTEAMACEAFYFDFSPPPISISITPKYTAIRERSENVHATIPKGIVGGFECSALQRNLKEGHGGHGHMFASA